MHLPTDTDDAATAVRDCRTDTATTILKHAAANDNVSLSILDKSPSDHNNGTESVVVCLVYQMHNQQLTLYFDCDKQVQNLFKETRNNYMRIRYIR